MRAYDMHSYMSRFGVYTKLTKKSRTCYIMVRTEAVTIYILSEETKCPFELDSEQLGF